VKLLFRGKFKLTRAILTKKKAWCISYLTQPFAMSTQKNFKSTSKKFVKKNLFAYRQLLFGSVKMLDSL